MSTIYLLHTVSTTITVAIIADTERSTAEIIVFHTRKKE